ncbi:MAG: methyltransferase domain-containing protein [Pseudonocardiaceae bacterium]
MTETAASAAPLTAPGPSKLLVGLVDGLSSSGALSPDWRAAFLAVPRHLFVPDLVWCDREDGSGPRPVRRAEQPDTWLQLVYRDEPIITQINDGTSPTVAPDSAVSSHTVYSSSTSMPTVVAEMLTALRAEPGMSVLEIGTGTGWNTALLAHRLGGEHVTSIEIDPQISAHAQRALADAGYGAVTVLTGDGALGHPRRAPYDRVLSTACVYQVPYPWIAQTRAGGLVLTPWGTEYHNGHLLAVTVAGDGTATGGIVGTTAFMTVRDQRIPWIPISDIVTEDSEARAGEKLSKRHPRYYVADYDARTAIGVQVPRCIPRYTPPDAEDPDGILWLLDHWSHSWAAIHHQPDQPGPYRVRQYGPRRLFDEVSAAYRGWKAAGKPPAHTWRITITPDGQRAELTGTEYEKAGICDIP